jgi:hypothetical protein
MKTSAPKFGLACAVATVLASSGALAASPKLKGTYAEVGETGCLVSTTVRGPLTPPAPGPVTPSGFDPVTLNPNLGVVPFLAMFSFHAIRTFDGEGSGTYQGRTAAINFSPSGGNATDIGGAFTYVVAPDGTISTEEDTVGAVIAGPRTGQSVTNAFALTGRASHNRHSLILATDVPRIETVTFSNGDVQQRICHRSRTLILTDD